MKTNYSKLLESSLSANDSSLFSLLKDCKPFVFSPIYKETTEVEEAEESFDLPYPTISLEVLDEHITIPRENDLIPVYIDLIVVNEINPKEYEFQVLVKSLGVTRLIKIDRSSGSESFNSMNGILKTYLKRLSKEKIAVGPKENKFKVKLGGTKEFFRPNTVVIVSHPKSVEKVESSFRHVEWSHRWEVRGHWRETSGLGKDRSGEYKIKGFTWVNNYTKGPENTPVIKKTYLINS